MSAYTDAVELGLAGLDYVSTGPALGCHECGLEKKRCQACKGYGTDDDDKDCQHCHGEGSVPCDETDLEKHSDNEFSWHRCDCCGSRLGGARYAAHGRFKEGAMKGELVHLDICEDCVMYINYGDEPERNENE